ELRSFEAGTDRIGALALSPDGRAVVTTSWPGPVRLWSLATGRELLRFEGAEAYRSTVCFSPDGKMVAAAGYDHCVRLWEVATGRQRCRFAGRRGTVWALSFAPDSWRLASGSSDTTVVVWDVTGRGRAVRTERLSTQDLQTLWKRLASEDAALAYRAIWTLATAPTQALPLLQESLRPAASVPAKHLARLIEELDGDKSERRERAARELERLREAAQPALQKVLTGKPGLEMRRRVEVILTKIEGALRDPEQMRGPRAIERLEHMAVPAARELLQKLAGGAPEALLTREAKAALGRMPRR